MCGNWNASFLWLRDSSACFALLLWQDASRCKENATSVLLEGTTDVCRCPALDGSLKRLFSEHFSVGVARELSLQGDMVYGWGTAGLLGGWMIKIRGLGQ